MIDNKIIEDLKNEFYIETKNCNVTAEDLKSAGVSDLVLKSEIYLKSLYGDDIIFDEEVSGEIDLSKKKVEKINLNELNKITELSKFIDSISASEFDKNLEILNAKIARDN